MKRLISLIAVLGCLAFASAAHSQVACPDSTTPCISGWTYGLILAGGSGIGLWSADGARKELSIENQPQSTGNLCVVFGKNGAGYNGVCNGHLLEPHEAIVMSNRGTSNNNGNVDTQITTVFCVSGSCAFSYYFSD